LSAASIGGKGKRLAFSDLKGTSSFEGVRMARVRIELERGVGQVEEKSWGERVKEYNYLLRKKLKERFRASL